MVRSRNHGGNVDRYQPAKATDARCMGRKMRHVVALRRTIGCGSTSMMLGQSRLSVVLDESGGSVALSVPQPSH
jgi:hypothetical protein